MVTFHPLDVEHVRALFPILHQQLHDRPFVYLDNAATTHKPLSVIRSVQQFYEQDNANIHRGMHALAIRSTMALEQVRSAVQQFLHAPEAESIIFTSGATEALNLIAYSYGEIAINAGDEVLISEMEHHANLIPWQILCRRKNAFLKVIPIDELGQLDLAYLDKVLTKRTKIVALTYVSNTLGTVNPIKTIIEKAHEQGAVVVIDGAQAVAHLPIDVAALDCDFFVFSAHKMYGPTGLGFLYGKKKWLEVMPPYQTGGGMVQDVSLVDCSYQDPPYKFEAGTLPLASIVAFSKAIDFLLSIGYPRMVSHETTLLCYALAGLARLPEVNIIGSPVERIGIIPFNLANMHHLDVGLLLDAKGIAVRTGHCCTQPLMQRLGVEGVVRLSFALYNTIEEIDLFLEVLKQIIEKRR